MHNTFKFLFFKGETYISKGIKLFTWGQYSHVGLLYNDLYFEAWYKGGFKVIKLWDETNRKEFNINIQQCVFLKNVFKNHKNGTVVDCYDLTVDLSDQQKQNIVNFLISQDGKKYDFLGILGFLIRNKYLENTDRWFCSEIIHYAFKQSNLNLLVCPSSKTSPTLLSFSPYLKLTNSYIVKNN